MFTFIKKVIKTGTATHAYPLEPMPVDKNFRGKPEHTPQQCIGCAACVDACDKIMDRMGYARGLIRYDTERGVRERLSRSALVRQALRPRVLVYAAVLAASPP